MSVLMNGSFSDRRTFNVISGKNESFKFNTSDGDVNIIFKSLYDNIYLELSNIYEAIIDNNFNNDLTTRENLLKLSSKIFNHRSNDIKYYNDILNLLQNYLTIINSHRNLYFTNVNCKNQVKSLNEQVSILNDLEKLKEYIETLRNSFKIFEDQEISLETTIQIDKEYDIYIQLYGYPNNGVFDLAKLQDIIDQYNLHNNV
jgi:hypothetical protein